MTNRARASWLVVVLLAALLGVAPSLPPTTLFPIAIFWLGGAAVVVGQGLVVLRRRWGTWPAAAVAIIALGGPAWLVGTDWSGTHGTYLPCRRNWAWLPSYLLRSSPTRSVTTVVGETRIKICYGSPRVRGRKMIGGPAVPFGHLWRTGANEPTTIRFDRPLVVGGIAVPPGKLALYTVPGPETWEIVLNRSTGQWGIESEYPAAASAELGRAVVVSRKSTEFAEALTMSIEPTKKFDSVEVVIGWEAIEVRIPITAGGRRP